MKELSKLVGGEAGMRETVILGWEAVFEISEPKDPRRLGVFEEEVKNGPALFIARKPIDSNIDLLQLGPGHEPIEGGEDLVQHRNRCMKLDFLDALHVG